MNDSLVWIDFCDSLCDETANDTVHESTAVLENDIERKIYVRYTSSFAANKQQIRKMIERFCKVVDVRLINNRSACVELDPGVLFHTYDEIWKFARNPINCVNIQPYAEYLSSFS